MIYIIKRKKVYLIKLFLNQKKVTMLNQLLDQKKKYQQNLFVILKVKKNKIRHILITKIKKIFL